MNFPSNISALNEDIIVEQLLRGHDPDSRWLDSEMLLQEVETILSFVLQNDVSSQSLSVQFFKSLSRCLPVTMPLNFQVSMPLMTENCITSIEVFESKETLPCAISRLSVQVTDHPFFSNRFLCLGPEILKLLRLQMLCPCIKENEIQKRTMLLFDLLSQYRWDAKAALVLGALAATYGGLLLPTTFSDPVAASIATLNQLPIERTKFRPWLNSLSLLVKAMLDVTKCITGFERLPFKQAKLDSNIVGETMSNIYLATYWIVKSALACMQHIRYVKQTQQVRESRKAAGELSSCGYQLRKIHNHLNKQVEECSIRIGEEIDQRLRNINTETHQDNQKVLHLLISLQDELPLQQYSKQIAITELKEKVTMVLLSKPELQPIEPFLFLLRQLYDHPSKNNTKQNYEILWIPIQSSQKWTDEEKEIFNFFSNSLPWISINRPWLMSSTVLKFLRTEWSYRGETMVVAMDTNGRLVHMNAMDMVLIWGARAYPFSLSRENELWEEEGWSMQLLLDGIHPELETWMNEEREICIFGSDNSDWVEEFESQARKIQNQGFQFELIYLSDRTREVKESSILFSPTLQQLFWLRLESIKRSKLKRSESLKSDCVLEEIIELLDFDYGTHKGWAIIGKVSTAERGEIVRFDGERMRRIMRWGEYATGLGFTEAIKMAGEVEEKPCEQSHTVVVPFEEGLNSTMRVVTCENCKRPMKKFVGYQ